MAPVREWPGARVLARPWPKRSSVRIDGEGYGWNSEAAVSAIFASSRGAVVASNGGDVVTGEVRTELGVHEMRLQPSAEREVNRDVPARLLTGANG